MADHHHRNLSDKLQTVSYTFQKRTPTNLYQQGIITIKCVSQESKEMEQERERETRLESGSSHSERGHIPTDEKETRLESGSSNSALSEGLFQQTKGDAS
jgi:hypothetical protein